MMTHFAPFARWAAALSCFVALAAGERTALADDIRLSTMTVDFGVVAVGDSRIAVVRAENLDAGPLRIDTPQLSGDCLDVAITPAAPQRLANGEAVDYRVELTPTTRGARSCSVQLPNNDPDPMDQAIAVAVTGIGSAPELSVSPQAVVFGAARVGSAMRTATVELANTGDSPLMIDAVDYAGVADFSVSGFDPGLGLLLEPGETAALVVTYQPLAAGVRDGAITVRANDPVEPLEVITVTATATAGLTVTPAAVMFGGVTVGVASQEVPVMLRNDGEAAVTIESIATSIAEFALTTPPGQLVLVPGATASLGVTFTPTAAREFEGALNIGLADGVQSVVLSGTGLGTAVRVTPQSFDYGAIGVCEPPVAQTFTIENIGSAAWTLGAIALDNVEDFTLELLEPVSLPAVLAPGQLAQYRLTAAPRTVGIRRATVTITTDITGQRVVMADAVVTGTAADLAVSAAVVDFGVQDVQAENPATRELTITNTGDDLTVRALRIEGRGAGVYALASPPALPLELAAGASVTIALRYRPTMASAGEAEARLIIEADATCGALASIPLTGRGIDRNVSLPEPVVEFEPTLRNPSEPRRAQVRVANTGDAPLEISQIVIEGADAGAFVLLSAATLRIAPGETESIEVGFAPSVANAAPLEAFLILTSDDRDTPMARVTLRGRGVLPNVALSADAIDLGRVGVGIPVRLSELGAALRLVNMDATESYVVRQVRVVDTSERPIGARVVSLGPDFGLPPMTGVDLDVELVARRPGGFEVFVEIYLANDPERVSFARVRGEAIAVEVRGGGCRVGGDGGLGGVLALLVLVLLRRQLLLSILTGLAAWAIGNGLARADVSRNLELQNTRAAATVEGGMFAVEAPGVAPDGAYAFSLGMGFLHNPLVVEAGSEMTDVPVRSRAVAELAVAYALLDRFEVGAMVPMLVQRGDAPTFSGVEPAGGTSLGDIALHGKGLIAANPMLSLAASVTLTIPTNSQDAFAGSPDPTAHARIIAGVKTTRLELVINGGARARQSTRFGDVTQGSELTYGFGAAYRVVPALTAVAELLGSVGLVDDADGVRPLEVLGGARYRVTRELAVMAGGGRGLLPGIGVAEFRALVSVRFSPGAKPIEPILTAEVRRRLREQADDDYDGIVNVLDRCPARAEDRDGFADDDGCPEEDDDGDGIGDAADVCPRQPEDIDGYEDTDGCPDLDNDGDGLADAVDRCPSEQEDQDGFEDQDGCPDPDNDHDGVPDAVDQCATAAETINGNADDDGCPDAGDVLVMVTAERLELFEPIRFRGRSAELVPESFNLLGQVAATLRAHADIEQVRVVAHVHPRGRRDQALAEQRAEVVREWLVQWGIAAERLSSEGAGSTQPLMPVGQRGAARVNDRIELVIGVSPDASP